MTAGSSPQEGSLSKRWTDAFAILLRATRLRPAGRLEHSIVWAWLARSAAALHFLALASIAAVAWQDGIAASQATGSLPLLHLLLLIATGATAALLALRPGERAAAATQVRAVAAEASPQLLAQMSHELRTPLNAMIGFSEVMLRELHGPLGHARYQEYAAYISESGGRLLKASEETLAIAATMSALMADRRTLRRERVLAATLLREAWAAAEEPSAQVRLAVAHGADCAIECDWRATGRALEHLLRVAIAHTPPDGAVEAGARRQGDALSIEIRVRPAKGGSDPSRRTGSMIDKGEARGLPPSRLPTASPPLGHRDGSAHRTACGGMRAVLARSLLEMQGATLGPCADQAGPWSACVVFPTTRYGRICDIAYRP
jgi:signal transduction histidine kinase